MFWFSIRQQSAMNLWQMKELCILIVFVHPLKG